MKMIRLHIVLGTTIMFLISSVGYAQNYKIADEIIIPPSPTSSVYRQFAGWQPNLSTGAAFLDIPLYEISTKGIKIPLSLNYYTTGIKVNSVSYPAGYGWSFSPGLRITRTILGRPDMRYERSILEGALDVENPDGGSMFEYFKTATHDALRGTQGLSDSNMVDTQHDIFTISLPTESTKFIVVKNESGNGYRAVTVDTLLDIEIVGNGDGFIVTDGKGVKYHFGKTEDYSGSDYYELVDYRYITSWMLRKIVAPGEGNVITMTWMRANISGLGDGYWLGSHVIRDLIPSEYSSDTNPKYDDATSLGTLEGFFEYPTLLFPGTITFPEGEVSFSYQSSYMPLLTTISVKNMLNNVVKSIDFTYKSTDGSMDNRILSYLDFSDEGRYGFSYYGNNFSNIYAQDWWGYYNGKNNTSLAPQIQLKVYPNAFFMNPQYYTYGYADRRVDTLAVKTNALKKITYPGGGYTEFEYETHSFDGTIPSCDGLGPASKFALTSGGGIRVKKVTSYGGPGSTPIVRNYIYGSGGNGKANFRSLPTPETFIQEYYGYVGKSFENNYGMTGYNYRMLYINTQSDYDKNFIGGSDFWYDHVTEELGDGSKTEYIFDMVLPEDSESSMYIVDFPHKTVYDRNSVFSSGPYLVETREYTASGALQRRVRNSYTHYHEDGKDISDIIVMRTGISMLSNGPDLLYSQNGTIYSPEGSITLNRPRCTYQAVPSRIHFHYCRLSETVKTEYADSSSITETENYTYSGPLLARKSLSDGSGIIHAQSYFYPESWAQSSDPIQRGILRAMFGLNMKSDPFKITDETITTYGRDSTSIFSSRSVITEYGLFSEDSLYLPSKIYETLGSVQKLSREYDYDSRGNIRTIVTGEGEKKSFLWSYESSLPVLEAAGMTFDELRALDVYNVEALPNKKDNMSINAICGSIRLSLGKNASVNSYTYEPLAGMLTHTDSRGWRTSYNYDKRWRLTSIVDGDMTTKARFSYRQKTDDAFNVSISTASSYSYGQTVQFSAETSSSAGNPLFRWILKNSAGNTVASSSESDSSSWSVSLSEQGNMTVICTVTDMLTGETTSTQKTFTVSPPTVAFSNISTSSGHATANINSDATVSLYLDSVLDEGLVGSAMINGNLYEFNGNYSNSFVLNLSGLSSFTLSITDNSGNGASGYIFLSITNVSSGYSIGSPSYIQVTY